MRILAIALASLVLCGCNIVISPKPMFFESDARGAAPLRPGIWVQADGECKFDPAAKVADWPKCADPMVIEATRMVDPAKPGVEIPYLLAAGTPQILQAYSGAKPMVGYLFIGIVSTKTDDTRQIVAARTWLALCGPPPPESADKTLPDKPNMKAFVTKTPFAGLSIDPDTGTCAPKDARAVRGAVAGSEALTDKVSVIRWVRDGKD